MQISLAVHSDLLSAHSSCFGDQITSVTAANSFILGRTQEKSLQLFASLWSDALGVTAV